MPASRPGEAGTAESLQGRLHEHLIGVRDVYERVIHAQKPMYYTVTPLEERDSPASLVAEAPAPPAPASSNLVKFLDQRAPQLAAVVARSSLRRSRDRFEPFLVKVLAHPESLARLTAAAGLAACPFR